MSNAGPSVTKHIKLNMCNPIFAESICNGTLGAQSGICLQLLRRHKTVCTWVLLKSEDSTQEILAPPATNPRVYLLNIYFATCEKTNSLQTGKCWRRLRTNKLCISFRTGLNILLSAAVNLIFFWGFFWVDVVGFMQYPISGCLCFSLVANKLSIVWLCSLKILSLSYLSNGDKHEEQMWECDGNLMRTLWAHAELPTGYMQFLLPKLFITIFGLG